MKTETTAAPWTAEMSGGLVGPACVVAPRGDGSKLILAQGSWGDCFLMAAAREMQDALRVLSLDPDIVAWLESNDPQALKQIRTALGKAQGGAKAAA